MTNILLTELPFPDARDLAELANVVDVDWTTFYVWLPPSSRLLPPLIVGFQLPFHWPHWDNASDNEKMFRIPSFRAYVEHDYSIEAAGRRLLFHLDDIPAVFIDLKVTSDGEMLLRLVHDDGVLLVHFPATLESSALLSCRFDSIVTPVPLPSPRG